MAQTPEGAKKARATIIEKYGARYYKNIGAIGGTKSNNGGFYYAKKNHDESHPAHPRAAGKVGGKISRKDGTRGTAE